MPARRPEARSVAAAVEGRAVATAPVLYGPDYDATLTPRAVRS
jgi:hypothetical protein